MLSENMGVLRRLVFLLVEISKQHESTKMSPRSLAYIFGPTLLKLQANTMTSILEGPKMINQFVLMLIQNADSIFDKNVCVAMMFPHPLSRSNDSISRPRLKLLLQLTYAFHCLPSLMVQQDLLCRKANRNFWESPRQIRVRIV